MNNKGYILTISTIFYVVIFILFLSLTTFIVYKSVNTDNQKIQSSYLYTKFNNGDAVVPITTTYHWCTEFFYYDANGVNIEYNDVTLKTYCEGYNAKRFI